MRLALAAALAGLTFAASALAEDAPKSVPDARAACRSSAIQLCMSEAMSGDRTAVRACLLKKLDKVSPDCREAIQAAIKARAAQQAAAPKP